MKRKEEWFCESCGKEGIVEAEEHIDVFGMVWKIDDAHRAVSPECPNSTSLGGYRNLRVKR